MAKYIITLPERYLLVYAESALTEVLTALGVGKFCKENWKTMTSTYTFSDEPIRVEQIDYNRVAPLTPEQETACEEEG
jgi:hypothetical protein